MTDSEMRILEMREEIALLRVKSAARGLRRTVVAAAARAVRQRNWGLLGLGFCAAVLATFLRRSEPRGVTKAMRESCAARRS